MTDAADRITITPPPHAGAHFDRCGWTVRVDGWVAYSGDERGARRYAAAMRKRFRSGSGSSSRPTRRRERMTATNPEPTADQYALAAWRHEAELCRTTLANGNPTGNPHRAAYLAKMRERLTTAEDMIALYTERASES